MQCPICRKSVAITDPYMPFCSERCKLLDLGNWASEKYVFSAPATPQAPGTQPDSYEDDDE